jgi:actin
MGWDDVEKVLHHTFYNELRSAPEEHPVLLVVPPQSAKAVKEKYCQIMFETFSVPALYIAHPAVLSLLATDRNSGLSVMSGHRGTAITPVYCGHALDHLTQTLPIGGQQVTDTLMLLLAADGYSFTTTAERAVVADMKERLSYVALDYDPDAPIDNKTYELPDGQVVEVRKCQIAAPEIIFQPQLHDTEMEPGGIHHKIVSVVESCMPFMRAVLYRNIVLSGGNTMFPGFKERLEKELTALVPDQTLRVIAPPERKYQTWIGGSLLSSLHGFLHMCISKEDYDETGPSVVHRKCF